MQGQPLPTYFAGARRRAGGPARSRPLLAALALGAAAAAPVQANNADSPPAAAVVAPAMPHDWEKLAQALAPKPEPRKRPALPENLLHSDVEPYISSVRRWAREFELPEALLLAVIHTESRFDPKARSPENAIGLMQIIPHRAGADAWAYLTGNQRIPTEAELLDPDTNIRLGTAYLRLLKDRYWHDVEDPAVLRALLLASYNWGVGNVRRRTRDGSISLEALQALMERSAPKETVGYLAKVQRRMQAYERVLVAEAEEVAER